MPENVTDSFINLQAEEADRNKDFLLKDKIKRQLRPALIEHQELLGLLVKTLAEEKNGPMKESVTALQEALAKRGCTLVIDESLPGNNWGSIRYENDSWVLHIRPEMQPEKESEEQIAPFALTEYWHELGALTMIQDSLRARGLDKPIDLDFEKNELKVKTNRGQVALTHLFDQVLQNMVSELQVALARKEHNE